MSTETLVAAPAAATPPALPAQRVDAFGQARVDYKTIALLALPLMLNSGLQAIVSLTDTWFVGHISTSAIAAMGAVYWVVLLFLVLIGGVGFAVQTSSPRRKAAGAAGAPRMPHGSRSGRLCLACRYTRRSPGRAARCSARSA